MPSLNLPFLLTYLVIENNLKNVVLILNIVYGTACLHYLVGLLCKNIALHYEFHQNTFLKGTFRTLVTSICLN